MEGVSLLEMKINWARNVLDLFYPPYLDKEGRLNWYYCKGLVDSQK